MWGGGWPSPQAFRRATPLSPLQLLATSPTPFTHETRQAFFQNAPLLDCSGAPQNQSHRTRMFCFRFSSAALVKGAFSLPLLESIKTMLGCLRPCLRGYYANYFSANDRFQIKDKLWSGEPFRFRHEQLKAGRVLLLQTLRSPRREEAPSETKQKSGGGPNILGKITKGRWNFLNT